MNIKFRVWDKHNHRWIDKNECDILMTSNGSVYVGDTNNPPMVSIDSENVAVYTGLRDIHDTEICEGDILDHYGVITRVHWNETGWHETVLKSHLNHLHTTFPITRYEVSKIIGNIYENKELLESN